MAARSRPGAIGALAVWIVWLAVGATAVADPGAAAESDPRRLVLQQSEVPAGFRIDARASRYWSNAAFTRGRPAVRRVVDRAERVTGYQAIYNKRAGARLTSIVSSADLYRGRDGARIFLVWADAQQRKANAIRAKRGADPYVRVRAAVGVEGWHYASGDQTDYELVMWRQGRVYAALHTWGVGPEATIDLARAQQRRIVAR